MNSARNKIKNHFVGIVFYGVVFVALIFLAGTQKEGTDFKNVRELLGITQTDIGNELDMAVLEDAIKIFYPRKTATSILSALKKYKEKVLTSRETKSGNAESSLNAKLIKTILLQAAAFFAYFLFIAFALFYLSESFAILKFKSRNRGKYSVLEKTIELFDKEFERKIYHKKFPYAKTLKVSIYGVAKALAVLILFSPAYLIGYVFKFDYGNVTFLAYVFLVIFTNGLLATSVNKFYRLLETEKSKGYVKTAKIKGVDFDYKNSANVTLLRIFSPRKYFGSHVLNQIYRNAHRQYLSAFKEIVRFQITGMIIVELSLNIQNGFFYGMLKSLMNKQYDVLLFVLMLIFFAVKFADVIADYFFAKENAKYEN